MTSAPPAKEPAPQPAASAAASWSLAPEVLETVRQWQSEASYGDYAQAVAHLWARGQAGDQAARDEILDAFARPLPIGTGGRRGPVGPGPNRMNCVTLRETVHGMCVAMAREGAPPRVVITYDTRQESRLFAHVAARQVAASGSTAILLDAARPTPQLSLLVRQLGCGAGVMISASHNPPGDNGIKIYGADGAQVIGERDRQLMAAILQEGRSAPLVPTKLVTLEPSGKTDVEQVTWHDIAQADHAYWTYVAAQGLLPGSLRDSGLRVVFTPLHGVGHSAVLPVLALRELDVVAVERQCDPDGGRFSTVASANPEVPEAFALALELADRIDADLAVATDPDADRMGACARDPLGNLAFLDGNRLAVILLDHVLRHHSANPANWVLTTMVTTPLLRRMATAHGVTIVDDLQVGFKHHAAMMAEQPQRHLALACEESHGFSRGNGIRDKDGASAVLLLSEAAVFAKRNGKTLWHVLRDVWQRYGYHRELTRSITAPGARGREQISRAMQTWRRSPPLTLAGLNLASFRDYLQPGITGSPTRDLPGDVVALELAAQGLQCRIVLRPSGTEPKIKVYALVGGEPVAPGQLDQAIAEIDRLAQGVVEAAVAAVRAAMDGAEAVKA